MSHEELIAALSPGSMDVDKAEGLLNELGHEERVTVIRTIGKKAQVALFAACEGRKVLLSAVVPDERDPLKEVIHHGKNSLPVFSHFQKRFCRSSSADSQELVGYNHQSMAWATGPGYFMARQEGDEVAIDYTRLPSEKPEAWPEIMDNKKKLSRFVYYGMVDYLRRVSSHVTIGRAVRHGKEEENYFLLVRED